MSYIYNLLKQFLAFLLNTTDKYVGNFGISIIIVTILIKIALLPLTLKQDKSMKEMKKIQPELEKLKAQQTDKEKIVEKLRVDSEVRWHRDKYKKILRNSETIFKNINKTIAEKEKKIAELDALLSVMN